MTIIENTVLSYVDFIGIKSFSAMKQYIQTIPSFFGRSYDDVLNAIQDVAYFYAQPFQPEMVRKLFKGWKQVGNDLFDCNFVLNKMQNVRIDFTVSEVTYQLCFKHTFNMPKNLDQFITDCSRSYIQLEWKHE